MSERSYRQFCAIARSLDRVGDRWTLLIVRSLMRSPRTFASLEAALPGISPSLLSERLAGLCNDGLVERNDAPRRSKTVEYRLTDDGRDLEPVLVELVRWGRRWMASGPRADDHYDDVWSGFSLKALLNGTTVENAGPGRVPRATVHVRVGDEVTTVKVRNGRRIVEFGAHDSPDAEVSGPPFDVLAVASGAIPLRSAGLVVVGDMDSAVRAISIGPASRD